MNVKHPDGRYILVCDECGNDAAGFREGMYPGDTDHLVYFDTNGNQKWSFSASDTEEMRKMLVAGDMKALQLYCLEECSFQPLFDCYCDACDKVLCKAHWNAGLCPAGHKKSYPDK